MTENSGKTAKTEQQINEADSLKGELASLFGEPVLVRALNSTVEDLDFSADEVVQACRELRRLLHKPEAQVMLARSLPDDLQTALCMSMLDASMPAKMLAAQGACLH